MNDFEDYEKEKIIQNIKNINKLFKECESPCLDKDIEIFIEYLKNKEINNPDVPEELKIMWKTSSEWHLIKDHYNVFGFNIHSPRQIIELETSNCIFGNDDFRKVWKDDHGNNSCGNEDWVCIVTCSEFDYIFVNLNKNSSLYGSTRYIINNCDEDKHLTDSPFSNFIDYIQKFIENINNQEF